ncbi:MAG: hypothetical protein WD711_00315 [Dongiaceae bacterium]
MLAADSMVSLEGQVQTPQGMQRGIVQNFSYANKVSRIKDYPIGVMSWGVGSINDRSIQSLIMEFEHTFAPAAENQNFEVRIIADQLLDFIKQRYDATFVANNQHPALGLFIGGFSHGAFFAEEYSYEFPGSQTWLNVRPDKAGGRPSFGINWYGQNGPLVRLIKGYDLHGLDELINRGVDQALIQKWVEDNVSQWPIAFDGMPIQDAIELADFAVKITIGMFRFGLGPPLCGGDVDVAVITPTAFQWAARKQWAIKS